MPKQSPSPSSNQRRSSNLRPAKGVANGESELTTFSVRLTKQQRELVTRAAAEKGWTPTGLIRTATLERAAHILNTASATSFDFRSLASEVVERLFKFRTIAHTLSDEEHQEISAALDLGYPAQIVVPVQPLLQTTLEQLKDAARLGGSEFLDGLVEAADRLAAPARHDLPKPIDPKDFL